MKSLSANQIISWCFDFLLMGCICYFTLCDNIQVLRFIEVILYLWCLSVKCWSWVRHASMQLLWFIICHIHFMQDEMNSYRTFPVLIDLLIEWLAWLICWLNNWAAVKYSCKCEDEGVFTTEVEFHFSRTICWWPEERKGRKEASSNTKSMRSKFIDCILLLAMILPAQPHCY